MLWKKVLLLFEVSVCVCVCVVLVHQHLWSRHMSWGRLEQMKTWLTLLSGILKFGFFTFKIFVLLLFEVVYLVSTRHHNRYEIQQKLSRRRLVIFVWRLFQTSFQTESLKFQVLKAHLQCWSCRSLVSQPFFWLFLFAVLQVWYWQIHHRRRGGLHSRQMYPACVQAEGDEVSFFPSFIPCYQKRLGCHCSVCLCPSVLCGRWFKKASTWRASSGHSTRIFPWRPLEGFWTCEESVNRPAYFLPINTHKVPVWLELWSLLGAPRWKNSKW